MKKSKPKQKETKEMTKETTTRIAEELVKSEGILAAIGDGISIQDTNYVIVYQNEIHKRTFGNQIGKHCYNVFQQKEIVCEGCPVAETFKDGKIHTVKRDLHTNKGIRYLEITVSPLRDSKGRIIAGIEVFRNVTDRESIEHELLNIQERLKFLLTTAPVAIYTAKPSGDYGATYMAGSITGLLGYKPEDYISKPSFWAENIHKDDRARVFREIPNIFKHGYHVQEYRCLHANGTYRWMRDEMKLVYDSNGNTKEIIGYWIDITESKKAENIIKKREKELEVKSHNLEELNATLNLLLKKRDKDKTEIEEKVLLNIKQLVIPYLEKLKKSGLDETQTTYADIIESNLNDIISPFTHRLSSKHLNLTPSEIKVANLVREGKTNKEIAEILNISHKTSAFHRGSIRKKLGLKNKKTNLKSYLSSLA